MTDISGAMRDFTQRAGSKNFELQKCAACGAVSWPPRDVCASCWSDRLVFTAIAPEGVIIAATALHASQDAFFRAHLPWRVGIVRLDAGPVCYAHLAAGVSEGNRVRLAARIDWRGRGVLIAAPINDSAGADDPALRDLINEERRNA